MIARFWHWILSLFHHAEATPLYMGVSVFTGWASPRPEYGLVPGVQCPNQYPWAQMKVPNRVPLLGQYDEANPNVTIWRISHMIDGKIDWCTYQHEWSPHLNRLIMNHCAENHPADSPIKFAMSWWDVLSNSSDGVSYYDNTYAIAGNAEPWTHERIVLSLAAYSKACAAIMAKPSYLKIDGRPVLFRGAANSLQFYAKWGLTPKQVLDLTASAITPRPYLVATACDPAFHSHLKSWGFDAFTEYTLYSDSWAHAMDTYRFRWDLAIMTSKLTGIEYWVPACAGFDARGYLAEAEAAKLGFFEPPTPADFTAHLVEARQFARDNAQYTRGRIISYAWSEYYEGGTIEPMKPKMLHDGDELLKAHAAAVQ